MKNAGRKLGGGSCEIVRCRAHKVEKSTRDLDERVIRAYWLGAVIHHLYGEGGTDSFIRDTGQNWLRVRHLT
jgi:hypothetical protein